MEKNLAVPTSGQQANARNGQSALNIEPDSASQRYGDLKTISVRDRMNTSHTQRKVGGSQSQGQFTAGGRVRQSDFNNIQRQIAEYQKKISELNDQKSFIQNLQHSASPGARRSQKTSLLNA